MRQTHYLPAGEAARAVRRHHAQAGGAAVVLQWVWMDYLVHASDH